MSKVDEIRTLSVACIGSRGVPSTYSGVETACEGLYKALVLRGHNVTMYSRHEAATISKPPQYYHGIRRVTLPAIRTRSLESLSHNAISLMHASTAGNYDIVHLHALAPGCFLPLRKLTTARVIATVHGLDWQRAKWAGTGARVLRLAERLIVNLADQIIVVSRDLQKYYEHFYGIETVYIPNGVEDISNVQNSGATLLKYGLEASDYLLFLGRLVPEKRVEDLLSAYCSVPGKRRLVIAGDNSSSDPYISKLRELAYHDPRVLFVGSQSRPAVHELISHAMLFINPAELEGLPMTVLECIQHGTPIVASDIAPHRELLAVDPRYNLFFSPRDTESLRRSITAAIDSIGYYKRLLEGIGEKQRSKHSWEGIAEQTENVYRKALGTAVPDRRVSVPLCREGSKA